MDMDMGMDMDMDMDMGMGTAVQAITITTTTTNLADITPIPFSPKHMHGLPILQRPNLTPAEKLYWENYNTTTFFTTDLGKPKALQCHVSTLMLCLLLIYPICLVYNNKHTLKYHFAFLTLNQILFIISFLSLSVYVSTFPNSDVWYPHNIYFKVFTMLFICVTVHYIFSLILTRSNPVISNFKNEYIALDDLHLDTTTTTTTPTTHNNSNSNNNNDHNNDSFLDHDMETITPPSNDTADLRHGTGSKFPQTGFEYSNSSTGIKIMYYIVNFLNLLLLLFMAVDFCIGLAIGNLFGKEKRIFNLLAHWIKGGVFVVLGVISLGRYCGIGKEYGWAWNPIIFTKKQLDYGGFISKICSARGTITMEGVESGLILFYGCTNVFLEHLAGAGGPWTAKDLQHVSIAFMYIGTGLCGVLIEIQLNKWRFAKCKELFKDQIMEEEENEIVAANPGYSPNPFPTLTIFWTGILMSQHAQASELSTKVHVQWGLLLSYGSFFRLLTYLMFYLKPTKYQKPTRPIPELITSFCLICGGIIFMESTDQVIEAMEYRGFTPLFTCNISVGVSMLLMAWLMILYMWKQRLARGNEI